MTHQAVEELAATVAVDGAPPLAIFIDDNAPRLRAYLLRLVAHLRRPSPNARTDDWAC